MIKYFTIMLLICQSFEQDAPAQPSVFNKPEIPYTPNIPKIPEKQMAISTNVTEIPQGNKVERPCQSYDLPCIQQFFRQHSNCKTPVGVVPEIVTRDIANFFYSSVNITSTSINNKYTGLNGRVEDFYINRETDKLVLVLEFRGPSLSSNLTFFRYYRRSKEPIITQGYAKVLFKSVVVTAVIPQVDNLRLDKADVFGFSNDLIPEEAVHEPSLGKSSDPVVPKMFAAFFAALRTIVTEYLFTDSAFYAATYIQHAICDFGLKLI